MLRVFTQVPSPPPQSLHLLASTVLFRHFVIEDFKAYLEGG